MTPETYIEADRMLARVPIERRKPIRDRLYETVAQRYARAREYNRSRVLSGRDAAMMESLRDLVCTTLAVSDAHMRPTRAPARFGPAAQRHASARRVLVCAIFKAGPGTALLDVAAFMRRHGKHPSIIWMRDRATQAERDMADAIVARYEKGKA